MTPIIELEEKEGQIGSIEAKTLFMELSHNLWQLPQQTAIFAYSGT